jgi:hypothetical protein
MRGLQRGREVWERPMGGWQITYLVIWFRILPLWGLTLLIALIRRTDRVGTRPRGATVTS